MSAAARSRPRRLRLHHRDFKPTTDLRAVFKGVLRDHLRADETALAQAVFPGSETVRPMAGLVAAA